MKKGQKASYYSVKTFRELIFFTPSSALGVKYGKRDKLLVLVQYFGHYPPSIHTTRKVLHQKLQNLFCVQNRSTYVGRCWSMKFVSSRNSISKKVRLNLFLGKVF
jgi:hypothetical protein